MKGLTFSHAALEDLRDIAIFWGNLSFRRRRVLLARIKARCKHIASNPRSSRPRPEILQDLFSTAVEEHIIFFYITVKGVEVSRIMHGSRNFKVADFEAKSETAS